jgi:hypothetical protein
LGEFGARLAFMPATRVIAVLKEPGYSGEKQRSGHVILIRFDPDPTKTRGQINNINCRTDLLEVARARSLGA